MSSYPKEHPMLLEKKARLYIIGGVALDSLINRQVFWFAVNRYGPITSEYTKERGIRTLDDWRKKYEPPRGTPEWEHFMRKLPEVYKEGDPLWHGGRGTWYEKEAKETLVSITPIPLEIIAPTEEKKIDRQTVTKIIKQIREIIWHIPVSDFSFFKAKTTTIADDIINGLREHFVKIEAKNKTKEIKAQFGRLILYSDMTQYCVVATGDVVNTEAQAICIIEKYLQEMQPHEDIDLNLISIEAPPVSPKAYEAIATIDEENKMSKNKVDEATKVALSWRKRYFSIKELLLPQIMAIYGFKDKKEASTMIDTLGNHIMTKKAAEGITPFIYTDLMKCIEEGCDFSTTKQKLEEKHNNFTLTKEDFNEAQQKKEASQDQELMMSTLEKIYNSISGQGDTKVATVVKNFMKDIVVAKQSRLVRLNKATGDVEGTGQWLDLGPEAMEYYRQMGEKKYPDSIFQIEERAFA